MKRNKPGNQLFWKIITTFGGAGYSPFAPGTAGSLVALIPLFVINEFSVKVDYWILSLIVIFTILGIIGSFKVEKEWGKDPQKIVVDEAVGMWISIYLLPFRWYFILPAFLLFRFFDIFKPLGIEKSQRLPGGYGVMGDDILAGIATNLILQAILVMYLK